MYATATKTSPSRASNRWHQLLDRAWGTYCRASRAVLERYQRWRCTPRIDVYETAETVEIRMDLPGVEPDATAVNLRGRRLSVSARREADGISCKVHRMERINGQLHRAVKLPCTVNSSVIDTQYKDGVLKISIAKKDKGVSHSCCPPEEQDW